METILFDRLAKQGHDFLGARYPIICGAMTWVSDPNLVASVCNAGGFAWLAGGNTPVEILEKQILDTRKLTDKPFGINLITIAPLYKKHLELMQKLKPSFINFAGSFPRRKEVTAAKETGAKVLCFASTHSIALRMIDYGADALILEGMEAGGHVGHVALSILLQQVLFEVSEVPVFVGGGIATGKMCAHLFLMGAAGIQMGTRFAMAKESCAHKNFKDSFVKARARDAVSTPRFDSRLPVVAVRALRNKDTDEFGKIQLKLLSQLDKNDITKEIAQQKVEEFWMGKLRDAVIDGDVSHGSLMAGQSVGLVDKEMSVTDIINELVTDTEKELQKVSRMVK
ncbi:MAG: nitronate monooxygenase [Desulfobacterales bacterium]|nr:nitronate monooxygenase [Desulfobacterales bacterium]